MLTVITDAKNLFWYTFFMNMDELNAMDPLKRAEVHRSIRRDIVDSIDATKL